MGIACDPPASTPGPNQSRVAAENARAIALLTAGDANGAIAVLQRVVEMLPDAPDGFVNLGIAYAHAADLEGSAERAGEAFRTALKVRSDHPHALYGLALLAMEGNRPEEARDLLQRVAAIDSNDPDVTYILGRVSESLRTQAEGRARQAEASGESTDAQRHTAEAEALRAAALQHYRRAIEIRPDYSSAYYNLGLLLARSRPGDEAAREEAKANLARNQALQEGGKINRFWGDNYSERGQYALAIRMFGRGDSAQIVDGAQLPTLVDVTAQFGILVGEDGDSSPGMGPSLVFFDRDNDGDDDLLIAGAGGCRLFDNQGGPFSDASSDLPDTRTSPYTAATAGDFDRNGRLDLFLTRPDGVALWLNDGDRFAPLENEPPGAAAGGMPCFVDYDHDGDLDVYTPSRTGPSAQLLRNLGTGAFDDVSAASGLSTLGGPALGSIWLDADHDADIDGVVATIDGPLHLFENRRHDGHVRHDIEVPAPGIVGLTAGDIDNDGWIDLVATRPSPPVAFLLRNRGGQLEAIDAFGALVPDNWSGAWGAALADLDNDGDLDLILTGTSQTNAGALAAFANDGVGGFASASSRIVPLPAPGRAIALSDIDGDSDLDLAVATRGGRVVVLRNEGGSNLAALPVRLVDADEAAATGRRRGGGPGDAPAASQPGDVPEWTRTLVPGAKLQMQTGRNYQKRDVRTASGLFAQSTRTVHFGLGNRDRAEAVDIEWSSGTLQGVLDAPAGTPLVIEEYDVRRGSCPFLFVWDGSQHRFLGDVLASSPPGLFIQPGLYAACDPDEYIRIPGDLPAPRHGQFELIVHESLQEVAYVDLIELWAVDAPRDVAVYPNERFTGPPPFPEHKLFLVGDRVGPRHAVDHRGRDVHDALAVANDGRTVNGFRRLDTPGFAEPHHIELDFGTVETPANHERCVLLLHGYLKFPGSPSQYDAFQRGLRFRMPSLERADENGEWQMVADILGAPAGLSRTMTYDITEILRSEPAHTTALRLRIRTNIEVYWDGAWLARVPADAEPMVQRRRVSLTSAELSTVGFPVMSTSPRGQSETYDYASLSLVPHEPAANQQVRWNRMVGRYTRFGEVRPLLTETDDMFVIFGPGEQIRLLFDAESLDPPADGFRRTFLLKLDGWVKDQFYHTATSSEVWPLPFHGMEMYPTDADERFPWTPRHRAWHAEYNTRVVERSASF